MKNKIVTKQLKWRCHTPNLLREILNNPTCGVLRAPLQIYQSMLLELAERALQLNDPILNGLMCRMTLYEESDPESKSYNRDFTEKIIKESIKLQENERTTH